MTNPLAYSASSSRTKKKSLMTLTPGRLVDGEENVELEQDGDGEEDGVDDETNQTQGPEHIVTNLFSL